MASAPLPLLPWDKSSILSSKQSSDSYKSIQKTAVDLFALGYPEYANQLINTLWKYGHGLEFDYAFAEDTLRCIYYAWDATDTIPSFAKNPSLEKILNGPISGEQNEKRQRVVVEGWTDGLPQDMRERILKGSLRDEDLHITTKRLRSLSDDSDLVPKTDYFTLAALVEVAVLAGRDDVAKELVRHEMAERYRQLQEKSGDKYLEEYEFRKWQDRHLGLSQSLRIWKILKDVALGKILQIDEETLKRFVQEGCELMEKRFIHGPDRPHADKSIRQLLQILDQNYVAARKLDPESGRVMNVVGNTAPDTFLRPGVTEAQIEELEKRLAQNPAPNAEDDKPMLPNGKLPEDYKEFLRISNGYFPEGNPDSGLLFSQEEVGTADCTFLCDDSMDLGFSLFPYDYTSIQGIDNIQLGHFDCFTIGIGGDEGTVILIPPTSVKPAIEAFEAAYAGASEENKRIYERGALDLYGGVDELRKLEWLCIKWEHWNTDQETWGGFKAHLEYCVDVAIKERKTEEGKAEKRERERRLRENIGQEDEAKGGKRKRKSSNKGEPNKATKVDAVEG
ncbi:SMI1-KNR4 domain containing protein [Pyrenophora tritici-repentis]|uniref:SMI1 / KNR4 protein n=2 Tax=Pyrenophora tritici-repentis TaxID=45151 RepID=A0A2W1GMP1_9PLEO|nr:uncharacterized protein PTRG_09015 [Pyrenophora tritici-repentis Pt-1C-BFP]KAA8627594.1 SMI1-KNR4 domain-containing protein [Pyrenophora tritici-repentis]EDU42066.1 predicted protein [Pyrenophora tritici-repentis Pt-1C-BFP]KAF7442375.1 SMI1-KNR4 domain containing protein [Pyrenophora tritici-repentis]KAF7579253.1 SMI1-KNR4 domain containing protein [Pyrenophora tritici-repentis]KAG9378181.1 SMI1-KNR4 domain containing protein [Pyrenophora tritici-repentis]